MKSLRAWLRERVRSYFSFYKAGGFVIVFVGLGFYLVLQIYNLATYPVRFFTDSRYIIAFVMLIAPPLVGFLLTRNFFLLQGYLDGLSKKYPRTANLLKLFSASSIKENKFPEVKIEADVCGKKIRLLGFVAQEYWQGGEVWCRVAIPTYPVPVTGNLLEIRKSDLIYTGRNLEDVAFTFISFGTK